MIFIKYHLLFDKEGIVEINSQKLLIIVMKSIIRTEISDQTIDNQIRDQMTVNHVLHGVQLNDLVNHLIVCRVFVCGSGPDSTRH